MWSRPCVQARGVVAVIIIAGFLLAGFMATWRNQNIYFIMNQCSPSHNYGEDISQSDLHKAYSHLKVILFFIGYPRSRHSLLGSLLDAHPRMVISDESRAFRMWKSNHSQWICSLNEYYDVMFRSSEESIARGRRSHVFHGTVVNKTSKYSYYVPNQWQGRYDSHIKVIGDKAGGCTARAMEEPDGVDAVRLLEKESGVKVKFVHVIRNPFATIATMVLQNKTINKRDGAHEVKIAEPEILKYNIDRFFRCANGSNKARMAFPGQVLDIPSMEIVKHPADTLRKVCKFLEIECSENYIQACEAIVDPFPSITRNFVEWPADLKKRVHEEKKRFSFFRGYSFGN